MIAGIDYSSRDVILACREHFGMASTPQLVTPLQVEANSASDNSTNSDVYSTFSGLAVMQKALTQKTATPATPPNSSTLLNSSHPASHLASTSSLAAKTYLLADMAACKHPTPTQMREIITQTIISAWAILPDTPRVALLSFSTSGSGGHDDTISLMQDSLTYFQSLLASSSSSPFLIDGEMQLDAAINPQIGSKKFPNSPVAGQANVLIAPDLNAGNLLYKAFEQIGGFTVAGPILQGFKFPVSDLSRGSTVEDIILTIKTMTRLTRSD